MLQHLVARGPELKAVLRCGLTSTKYRSTITSLLATVVLVKASCGSRSANCQPTAPGPSLLSTLDRDCFISAGRKHIPRGDCNCRCLQRGQSCHLSPGADTPPWPWQQALFCTLAARPASGSRAELCSCCRLCLSHAGIISCLQMNPSIQTVQAHLCSYSNTP